MVKMAEMDLLDYQYVLYMDCTYTVTWIVYVQYITNKDEKTLYNIMLVPIHVQVNLYFFRVILAHLVHLVHRDSLAPLE